MSKITFRYDIHKAIWNTLAEHAGWSKREAVAYLKPKFPDVDMDAMPHGCAACKSALDALRIAHDDPTLCDGNAWRCYYCPLDWGRHGKCCDGRGSQVDADGNACDPIYTKWVDSYGKFYGATVESAKIIANLPLSEENKSRYDIVE